MDKESIAHLIWNSKYRYQHQGECIDQSIEDTWLRVAKALSRAEKTADRKKWQREFYRILENDHFLPGGRILAGAGTKHQVTLLNCFVMPIIEDSLHGIFTALKEGALTLQQGGGVGFDFSVLRPEGELAKHTGMPASGPVSFMKIFDAMCDVLLSTGARRGAMMGVMRCDHPDIEAFIAAKAEANLLRHFNLSVFVSDPFMQAVKENGVWPLTFNQKIYKKVNARELWEKIIRAAYDYAEPGVLFGDTINRQNNLWYREQIHATNPCGEIPLPAYGACDLGAINLTRFVIAPFTPQAAINWTLLEETTCIGTRLLDNVLDVSHYPLPQQKKMALNTRRIGLGVTGLADLLVMMGIKYGTDESIKLARAIMQRISEVTWLTSIDLAKEKGMFPFYESDYLRGEFVQALPDSIKQMLSKFGVRNSHHNTIAPTGTISLLANNVSNGIEPIFRTEYERLIRDANDERQKLTVKDYAYQAWFETNRSSSLPPAWIDAESLDPSAHLAMQAALQPFIDNAISKTINVPADFPFNSMLDVYTQAYELGLKGCTVFRPNKITGSVLTAKEDQVLATLPCCQ